MENILQGNQEEKENILKRVQSTAYKPLLFLAEPFHHEVGGNWNNAFLSPYHVKKRNNVKQIICRRQECKINSQKHFKFYNWEICWEHKKENWQYLLLANENQKDFSWFRSSLTCHHAFPKVHRIELQPRNQDPKVLPDRHI